MGTHEEAKAVTLYLSPIIDLSLNPRDLHGSPNSGPKFPDSNNGLTVFNRPDVGETRAFYEFDVLRFLPDPNTVISQASFGSALFTDGHNTHSAVLQMFGYLGKGTGIPETLDYGSNFFTYSDYFLYENPYELLHGEHIDIDVTSLVTSLVNSYHQSNKNYNDRPLIGIGVYTPSEYSSDITLRGGNLVVTAEPVPEPTTIFSSAMGLCLGGWLKRRKLTLPNKPMS